MSFSFDHVPEQQRCYQSIWGTHRNWPIADCFFGVPSSASYGRKRFTSVPFFCRGFHFYLGADQQDLFDSYIESDWPAWTRSLHIGNSSYDLGKGSDYSRLMASLARTDFPRLEKLELGVWQLFCNSHCLFGQLGNLDGLGSRMPRLTSLSLFGNFELQEPLSIPTLERLDVQTDDPITCLNGGPLDVETVQNIFRSSFENLREFCAK